MKIFNLNKKRKTIIIYIIATKLLFVAIQFFPVNKPKVIVDNPNDLIATTTVPKNIALKLKTACYDCHSNQTKLPWYASIAPTKWFIYKHINEGREELNFSNWNTYNKEKKAEILDDISTVVYGDEMPLKKYTVIHPVAKLSKEDKEDIINWADKLLGSLYK
jgi:hypothetical protein